MLPATVLDWLKAAPWSTQIVLYIDVLLSPNELFSREQGEIQTALLYLGCWSLCEAQENDKFVGVEIALN